MNSCTCVDCPSENECELYNLFILVYNFEKLTNAKKKHKNTDSHGNVGTLPVIIS